MRTDYVGVGQYEQDTLRWLTTAAGRALRTVDRTSGAVTYNYEYSLKDHLGNLRVAFRRGARKSWTASLEPGAAAWETKDFDAASVSAPIANAQQASSGSYSALLNAGGSTPQPIGPTRIWPVQGGDTLHVSAYAHYIQPYNYNTWHFVLPTFVAGYLANPPAGNPDGASTTKNYNWLQVGLAAGLSVPSFGSGVPHAYLRLLVYKADSTLLLDRPVPISSAAQSSWEPLSIPRFVLPVGAAYAQVYVAEETNINVWFDELTIVHWPGLQVQEQHYDPFGLDLAGLSRSTPGLKALSQYQWNGKEKQSDFGLGWTHLDWRFFDPQTGRFHAVDPLTQAGQESWSTYQFGFDNAVRYNDPDGRCPCEGESPSAAGIIYNTVVGIGVSAVNTVLALGDYSSPGGIAGMLSGQSVRASVGSDGEVSYGTRPAVTSGRQLAGYVASDALDMAGTALVVATSGGAGLAWPAAAYQWGQECYWNRAARRWRPTLLCRKGNKFYVVLIE